MIPGHSLPPLYDRWVTPLLQDHEVPKEGRATCDRCAMCPSEGHPVAAAYAFRPDVKCCVHLPDLPNFLVGRILSDQAPDLEHGRNTVWARIQGRVAVTPFGVAATPAYTLLHQNSANAIGRMRTLRCPHFVEADGSCGIHRHRNHLCATWFCKHERGMFGALYWQAMKRLILSVETHLSRWCALKVGLEPDVWNQLLSERFAPTDASEIEGPLSDEVYRSLWGSWMGRERQFYETCGALVEPLTSNAVLAICGPDTRGHLEVARAAARRLAKVGLPPTLRTRTYQLLGVSEEGASVMTYSSTDPIGIPAMVLSVLHLFDGRPTDEVLKRIREERGIELHPELVRELVDWGVVG